MAFLRLALGFLLLPGPFATDIHPAAASTVCYVKWDAAGAGSGTSWKDAYRDLQSALGNSRCVEVWVARGIYKPTTSRDREISFVLRNGLNLYGGFSGTESLLGQRNADVNRVVLSGDIGDLVTADDNSYHVVVGVEVDATARLDGFTIVAGRADGPDPNDRGGGVYLHAGSPTLANLTFNQNSAAKNGGGLFAWESSSSLMNVTFRSNSASGRGGGMYASTSTPTLANVAFHTNSAREGGGMAAWQSRPTLTKVLFQENSAAHCGGMFNWRSDGSLANVIFDHNTASQNGGVGGGMCNISSSSPSVRDTTFTGNSANMAGGMFNRNDSHPLLTNLTFIDNWAKDGGGGLWNATGSNPSLSNSTFIGNLARNKGGALYNYSSSPSLTNITFAGNFAHHGGAIRNKWNSSPTVQNSILYGNTGGQIFNDTGSSITIHHSVIQGGYEGVGNLDADPLLGPMQNNGGLTLTMAPGFGSPAIDAGTDTGCPSEDQRRMQRPHDGDGNGSAICDIGAVESPFLYRKFLTSTGAEDGWILESDEDSSIGGTLDASRAIFLLGDDDADRQYRGILSFNTSGLPDNAVITQAALKIQRAGTSGTNPFFTHGQLNADIGRPYFGPSAALGARDFQAWAGSREAAVFTGTHTASWQYAADLSPEAYAYISLDGPTQFRLRFPKDDNDDLSADILKFYSGDVKKPAFRPQMIITYYVP